MKKRLISIFVLSLAIIQQGRGESSLMSLHDCMVYAISKSTKIRIKEADINDKRLEIRDAILTAFTPSISVSSYAYYNFGRSIDPQTNTYFNLTSFHNSYSLSASIDLFDGLAAVNNIRISKTGLLISRSEEKQAEADICLAVMESYYNVVYYKRLADVYSLQIKEAERALESVRRQEELGLKGHADVIEMEATLADREYDHTNTINLYNEQMMALEALLFWSENIPLQIDTSLPQWNNEKFDANDIILRAMGCNPEISIAKGNMEISKRNLQVAKWQLLPRVTLYGGWNTSYYTYTGATVQNFGNQFRNNGGEYIELGVTLPIYNRLKGHSNISMKRNAYKKAIAELDQKMMDVENEVRRAIQDCDGASTAYQQALKKSWVQEEAYTLNQKKLEQDLISPLEFQTANNNYLRAKADEMNSLFKYIIKQAVVKYYGGIEYVNQ